jgi:hypothetical protein
LAFSEFPDWIVLYRTPSEREFLSGFPLLHLASWGDFSELATLKFSDFGSDNPVNKTVSIDASEFSGIMTSLPAVGVYEVEVSGEGGNPIGFLCAGESSSALVTVAEGEKFYGTPRVCARRERKSARKIVGIEAGACVAFLVVVFICCQIWRCSRVGWRLGNRRPSLAGDAGAGYT